jgi:hypothetical protein
MFPALLLPKSCEPTGDQDLPASQLSMAAAKCQVVLLFLPSRREQPRPAEASK